MLPNSIDEYVSSGNVVRFIDAFVDKEIKSNSDNLLKGKSVEGRPSYSPNCLCKLLIYGYLNGLSSSRKLERETNCNLEVIWLMNNLRPDHWTISDFRKTNGKLIRQITLDFRKFLKESGYIKGKSVSTDGTKIKAYASRETISLKLIDKKLEQAEKEIERYYTQLQENDSIENEQMKMLATSDELKTQIAEFQIQIEELKSQKALLETLNRESLAPSDYEAKIMKTKDGFLPSYNVQTTVDNESHFITTCEVTDYPNDYHSLKENIDILEKDLDIVPEIVLADAGYANEDDIQSLEKEGIECIVPFPDEPEAKKVQRDNGIWFRYDKTANTFTCSQGKSLLLVEKNCRKRNHLYSKYQCKECDKCPKREACTKSETGRIIYHRQDGEWLNAYLKKTKTDDFKEKFKPRKCVVEHPYGTIKYMMGQIPIFLRGKRKVQIEMDLYSTAYNLKHLLKERSVSELIAQLAQWQPICAFYRFLCFLKAKIRHYCPYRLVLIL